MAAIWPPDADVEYSVAIGFRVDDTAVGDDDVMLFVLGCHVVSPLIFV